MGGILDPEEREYFTEVKSRSEKAFSGATRLLRTDTRWNLIHAQAERAVPRVIFHDEFRSSVIEHQLVMYIPEGLLDSARLPDRAVLYPWPNVFHPLTTLSFFWINKPAKSYRGYFLPDGAEVDCAKRAPIILAFIADNRSQVLQAFEIDLRPLTLPSRPTGTSLCERRRSRTPLCHGQLEQAGL
jgi:hypothetical protein